MPDDSPERDPQSTHPHAAAAWPVRLAKRLLPKNGKSGTGASGAMAQLHQDRLAAARTAWTPEDQIRLFWRARSADQRNLAGVRQLQEWLGGNAPELLPVGVDGHGYLLRVLADEIQDELSDPAKEL